jgi:hypothetical protein
MGWCREPKRNEGATSRTLLFSNTQRVHELKKIDDWVVVYFHNESDPDAQCTIVTETRGPSEGRR